MDDTGTFRHDRWMTARAVVVAVCGSPGAGKTTVGRAVARRLGVLFLARDEIKGGLGLSSAALTAAGEVRLNPDFHIAGGPMSVRAEGVMVEAARLLAAARVSFVVESSVVSRALLNGLVSCGARVLAVHVVASAAVVGQRLSARAAGGGEVNRQLAARFRRGEMAPSIFEPPEGVDAVVEIDTSGRGEPAVDAVEAAVAELLR